MADEPTRHERYDCTIELTLLESEGDCRCAATLTAPRGTFTGIGSSRRHPDDPVVPLIGEELAIGRALTDLGDQLVAAAMEAVEDHESRPIHLIDVS